MTDTDYIQLLREHIEKTIGRKISRPRDFEYLSQLIFKQTKESVSISTLKRFWGYVASSNSWRVNTLDILCDLVGYSSWDGFRKYVDNVPASAVESNIVLGERRLAQDLTLGELLRVEWPPNRVCIFKYLGDERFIVEQSINSKLSVGDEFQCSLFIAGEPLYLSNLMMKNKLAPVDYVCGRNNGVHFAVIDEDACINPLK